MRLSETVSLAIIRVVASSHPLKQVQRLQQRTGGRAAVHVNK